MGGLQKSSDRTNQIHEEQRALIERILASSLFEKSSRLSDFLQYICDRSLGGHPDEVREQLIGHHVFDRPVDFNSADDTIVRVTARKLRYKLREYFETEGRKERWVVEIPKGGYLPVFRERKPQAPIVLPVTPDAQSDPKPFLLTRTVVLILTAVVLLFFGVWVWKRAKRGTPPASQSPIASPITNIFAGSKGPVRVVLADSALVRMEGLLHREFSLEQYADHSYLNFPKELAHQPGMRRYWHILSRGELSNAGDVDAGSRFLAAMSAHGSDVAIRNARNMTTRDFMNGNFILLGSVFSDPWTQLFTKGLNFQFVQGAIRNLNPSKGERNEYSQEQKANGNSLGYARIALVPNLTNTGRVLLVAGINVQSTEAASDFLLDPSSTRKLRQIMGTDNPGTLRGFELVLQTSVLAGAAKIERIVAFRVYRDNPSQQK